MVGPLANSKHELVVQAIFSGATLAEAAAAGGFTGKWPESHACNIAKRPECRARLEELHKLAADEKIMTVIQRKIRLSEIARASYNDPDRDGDPIRAIDILNKMCGDYAPNRMELTGQHGGSVRIEDTRAKLLLMITHITERICTDIPALPEDGEGDQNPPTALQISGPLKESANLLLDPRILTQEAT